MTKLRDLELAAVDVLAGGLTAVDRAKALLELAVVGLLVLVIVALDVDVGALVGGLGAREQASESPSPDSGAVIISSAT